MNPDLPAYFDPLIAARRAGHVGRDVHLGYWDSEPATDAPCSRKDFETAQARLTARTLDLLPLSAGQNILDVACGFGGALAEIDARLSDMTLTGLNIDARQLALCAGAVKRPANRLTLVEADACALPFADASFDNMVCIEAMFHFGSRRAFFTEAARCLRPGGVLATTDILIEPPGADAPWPVDDIAAVIRRDYGPWPDIWATRASVMRDARAAGLEIVADKDWSRATLPSYRIIAPERSPGDPRPIGAGDMFAWLHRRVALTYRALSLRRQSSSA